MSNSEKPQHDALDDFRLYRDEMTRGVIGVIIETMKKADALEQGEPRNVAMHAWNIAAVAVLTDALAKLLTQYKDAMGDEGYRDLKQLVVEALQLDTPSSRPEEAMAAGTTLH